MTSCDDARALAPEAALGSLSGGERAALFAHLDTCEECRELVNELSVVADDLVLLSPAAEPPPGFEERVLARLVATRRRRRWPVVAGAAAACVLALVGFTIGRVGDDHDASVRELTMRTPSGRVVGDAYLHGDDPTWVFVAVPGWTDTSTDYQLHVTLADGSTTTIRGGSLAAGQGAWGTVLDVRSGAVREVALIGDDGRVWCSASV